LDIKKDLHPVALVYPDREGETYGQIRRTITHKIGSLVFYN
jgi:hypothetical protein